MFKNVRFKARYIQPDPVVTNQPEPVVTDGESLPRPVAGKKKVIEQDYQINCEGRFLLTIQDWIWDEQSGVKEEEGTGPVSTSFNGEVYHCVTRSISGGPGLGSVFTPQQPFFAYGSMIKPTFFMDQMFNDRLSRTLADSNNVGIKIEDDGNWRIECRDANAPGPYDLIVDPTRDFVITRMSGYWTRDLTFEKKMEYGRTPEGFYYLKKGTISLGGAEPGVMEVDEFVLNGPEPDYILDFPIGTRVTDHTKGWPEIYYKGQPGRTAEDSGDPSIYTTADRLNRFDILSPDVLLEGAGDREATLKKDSAPMAAPVAGPEKQGRAESPVQLGRKRAGSGSRRYLPWVYLGLGISVTGAILYAWSHRKSTVGHND